MEWECLMREEAVEAELVEETKSYGERCGQSQGLGRRVL